jgi:hypothetical protein
MAAISAFWTGMARHLAWQNFPDTVAQQFEPTFDADQRIPAKSAATEN